MAILSSSIKPASNLKKIIKSMDAINKKEARLTINHDSLYLDLTIHDQNSSKPVIARLCLNSKWFNAFEYCDLLHIGYPLIFDFSQFRNVVLSCDDSHLLELYVITCHDHVRFQLRSYDGVLTSSDGVQPQSQTEIVSCKLSENTVESVRTFNDIVGLSPVIAGLSSIPSIHVLLSSIQNNDLIDIHATNQTVILTTRTAYHCFRKGVDCGIINLNNPGATILLRLNLNRTSYMIQALTSTDIKAIDVIYPAWSKQKELRPPILRIWFDLSAAYLDFEFPWDCNVQPQISLPVI